MIRRVPKCGATDGRQRQLGIAMLEDKIAQRAVVEVVNAVYEVGFLDFSYGSGLGVACVMHWMRSRSGSSGRR